MNNLGPNSGGRGLILKNMTKVQGFVIVIPWVVCLYVEIIQEL